MRALQGCMPASLSKSCLQGIFNALLTFLLLGFGLMLYRISSILHLHCFNKFSQEARCLENFLHQDLVFRPQNYLKARFHHSSHFVPFRVVIHVFFFPLSNDLYFCRGYVQVGPCPPPSRKTSPRPSRPFPHTWSRPHAVEEAPCSPYTRMTTPVLNTNCTH